MHFTPRNFSLSLLLVGALNWGVTAVALIARSPISHPPTDIPFLLLDEIDHKLVVPVQITIYFAVFASGVYYLASYALPEPRC